MPLKSTLGRLSLALVLGTGLLCSCAGSGSGSGIATAEPGADSITIVVTDSGLGGLSVVADAARKLAAAGTYRHVELVFYNALFTDQGGYNSLKDRDQKVRIFSRALQEFQARSHPDVILIACNTLSVLYPDTEFRAGTRTPVRGIVEGGVELIAENLPAQAPGKVILFATETTVEEGTHQAALLTRGLAAQNIVTQACPELASYIELGFDSLETEFLIDAYVAEALAVAGEIDGPLYVSFNCTHYGYALEAWRTAFAARNIPVAGFLNPNETMIDFLLTETIQPRDESTSVTVRVVSMVEIPEQARRSIGRRLHEISPETEAALQSYEWVPDLFPWRDHED